MSLGQNALTRNAKAGSGTVGTLISKTMSSSAGRVRRRSSVPCSGVPWWQPVRFARPVPAKFKIVAHYGDPGLRWDQQLDLKTGYWIPRCEGYGNHHGYDFECPSGTPVSALAPGQIVRADFYPVEEMGNAVNVIQLVVMPGFDSWWIRYDHLVSANVTLGQAVGRGELIGHSGIGQANKPYLHVDMMDPRHQYRPILWEN